MLKEEVLALAEAEKERLDIETIVNTHGHFDHERRPHGDRTPEAVEYHAAVMKNYFGSKKELNLADAE